MSEGVSEVGQARPGIRIIGGGLAGCEAAWQIAAAGFDVELFEMRPVRTTPAHQTDALAELVCSNSFGSEAAGSASQLLKAEMTLLGSLVLGLAKEHRVPAGASLAVDRVLFSQAVTRAIENHPRIHVTRAECTELGQGIMVVASGPLTSEGLGKALASLVGSQSLYFYDAISPIVSLESLDLTKMYFANRYDKGESSDFLNIPLSQSEYETFVGDLLSGEMVLPHDFEEEKYFEGCMPVEAIAARGMQTLAFGPMKPVGLRDPRTGRRPHAVIQLRAENRHRTAYGLVGFQTKLKYGDQQRVFRKLPGMENAEFLRLGSMHRNTYVDSPKVLSSTLALRQHPQIFLAGQITGTEGYLESVAMGLLAGLQVVARVSGRRLEAPPPETMLGALVQYVTDTTRESFQPINANFGLLPPLWDAPPTKQSKEVRRERLSERALLAVREYVAETSRSC